MKGGGKQRRAWRNGGISSVAAACIVRYDISMAAVAAIK